jgi:hypothetical protein
MQIVSACVIRLWMCFCCRKPKVDDKVGTPLVVTTPPVDGETEVFSTPETSPDRLQTQNPKPKQGCCERVAFFFQQESTQNCFRRTVKVLSN